MSLALTIAFLWAGSSAFAQGVPSPGASTKEGSPAPETPTSDLRLSACGETFDLLRIPSGAFLMGSEGGEACERPVHRVQIARPFYLGRTEVTVRQFRTFVLDSGYMTEHERSPYGHMRMSWRNPLTTQTEGDPVLALSWNDAKAFCDWLAKKTGHAVRLPSEAEWEYAARAGTAGDHYGPLDDVAWYSGNCEGRTRPVGQKKPNAFGLHDMLGNAWEWVEDPWHETYEWAPADGSVWSAGAPPGLGHNFGWQGGDGRVVRGGAWGLGPAHARSSARSVWPRDSACNNMGLRIACSLDAASTLPTAATEIRGIRFEFVAVPAGEFLMGSNLYFDTEKPVHSVRIGRDFEMGTTEVTVRQFRAFVDATRYQTDAERAGWAWAWSPQLGWEKKQGASWRSPGFSQSDDEPVLDVSWNDAVAFCRWLSTESEREVRLPSEAEWEYAARGGTTGDYGVVLEASAWYGANSGGRPHLVAQKKPNLWGLYDMAGNVREWCQDSAHFGYEGASADGSPLIEVDGKERAVRGGSWCQREGALRSSYRFVDAPDHRSTLTGFRVVRARGRSGSQ